MDFAPVSDLCVFDDDPVCAELPWYDDSAAADASPIANGPMSLSSEDASAGTAVLNATKSDPPTTASTTTIPGARYRASILSSLTTQSSPT